MCTKKRFCELISLHPKTIYKTSQKERRRSEVKKKRGQKDEEVLSGIRAIIKDRPTYGYKRVTALYNKERKGKGLSRYKKKRIYRVMRENGLLLPKAVSHRKEHKM